jgi:hypothetical protein
MSSETQSDDDFYSTSTSPLSSGASAPTAIIEGEATPTQSNPGFGMQPTTNDADHSSPTHSKLPDQTAKEPARHDSITNLLDDYAFYAVEDRGRIRSSFSFGGQSAEESVRQQSIVVLPEQTSLDHSPRTSAQPCAQSSDATSTSSWTSLLVWIHQSILNLSNTVYPLRARRAWEW